MAERCSTGHIHSTHRTLKQNCIQLVSLKNCAFPVQEGHLGEADMCPSHESAKRHARAQVVRQYLYRLQLCYNMSSKATRCASGTGSLSSIRYCSASRLHASRKGRLTESMSSLYLSLDSSDAAGTFMPCPWLALAVVDMLVQSRSVKTVLCASTRGSVSRSLLMQNVGLVSRNLLDAMEAASCENL